MFAGSTSIVQIFKLSVYHQKKLSIFQYLRAIFSCVKGESPGVVQYGMGKMVVTFFKRRCIEFVWAPK